MYALAAEDVGVDLVFDLLGELKEERGGVGCGTLVCISKGDLSRIMI